MDIQLLQQDLDAVLSKLPPHVLRGVSNLILENRETFAVTLPNFIPQLMPHIQAAIMEKAMGILDIKEIEAGVMAVLTKYVKPDVPVSG